MSISLTPVPPSQWTGPGVPNIYNLGPKFGVTETEFPGTGLWHRTSEGLFHLYVSSPVPTLSGGLSRDPKEYHNREKWSFRQMTLCRKRGLKPSLRTDTRKLRRPLVRLQWSDSLISPSVPPQPLFLSPSSLPLSFFSSLSVVDSTTFCVFPSLFVPHPPSVKGGPPKIELNPQKRHPSLHHPTGTLRTHRKSRTLIYS